MGKYHWESLSDEKFCKIDNSVLHKTPTKSWWKHGVFECVCENNHLSWVDNRMMKGSAYKNQRRAS